IANYAVENQKFGGPDYEFDRVTWLKPSFLWMMNYSGWAGNKNQENVLAIKVDRKGFDSILHTAVLTEYYKSLHPDSDKWKEQLNNSEVKLQWEPYYDLYGNKSDRKAVKIGISGGILERFNNEWIMEIQNITPYVRHQQQLMLEKRVAQIELPHERAYAPDDLSILKKIDATTISL
ncbi:MAG: DUF4291 family protein, partial [Sphingobacteriales bacterium]